MTSVTINPPRRTALILVLLAVVIAIAIGGGLAAGRIASERQAMARLDATVATRVAEVDALRSDVEVRSRLSELDRWGTMLGLTTPTAGQFASGGETITDVAAARRQASRVDGAVATYPRAERAKLDDLVAAISH